MLIQMRKYIIGLLIFFIPFNIISQLSEKELISVIKHNEISKVSKYLKNKKNDPNLLIGSQNVPIIHYAAGLNKVKVVEMLINAGADINILYYNDTPLMTAIYYGHPQVVKLLLKRGADVNYKDSKHRTAAIKAVRYNKPELLKILYESKADLAIKNKKGKSAIDYAYELQNIECYKYLKGITENKYKNKVFPEYFDGPYIFWQGKSKLTATYLINDRQTNETLRIDSVLMYKKDKTELNKIGQAFKIPIRRVKNTSSSTFEFYDVEKIMAIGDLHGEFDTFQKFLINNKVIDKNYNWSFGKGHLVLAGDIFDRGTKVSECFWLLYKLEAEAEKQGGKVHFVLGNHEIMQISGDKRYLSRKYLNLFNRLGINYTDFYDESTEIGRWLRSKNSVIKINDIIFLHGGLSRELVDKKISLSTINSTIRTIINRKIPEPITQMEEFIISDSGPLWYRGYIKLDTNYYKNTGLKYDITQKKVDEIISFYKAKAIVFANTHVKEITPLFNFKLYGIDIPFAESKVELQGLYIENGHFYKSFLNGTNKIIR